MGEYIYLQRLRKKFKWRIAVGGIRGKSSVTRLIAGAMREAEIRVIARTTGSKPVVIFPNGQEEEIERFGSPNILEGKKFLRLAHREKAEAMVVELMAIKPECLEAEVKKIFKPHLLLFTNFRPDHEEELGRTREEVSRNLLRSVEKGATIFLLEEEIDPEIKRFLEKKRTHLISVPQEEHLRYLKNLNSQNFIESERWDLRANYGDDFWDNIRLALAVTRHLGINDEVAISGMKKAKPDFGSLKIWEMTSPGKPPGYAVSAFAANEPFSSSLVLKRAKELIPWEGKNIYGLLLFRPDRGDRTEQWLKAIRDGFFDDYKAIFLVGCPYSPFIFSSKKLKKIDSNGQNPRKKGFLKLEIKGKKRIKEEDIKTKIYRKTYDGSSNLSQKVFPKIKRLKPEAALNLMTELSQREKEPWILIGLGNIVGWGTKVIELWEATGRRIYG